MITNDKGKQLHDKASRGKSLTAEEHAQLEEWYAFQDQAEAAALGANEREKAQGNLQAQIEDALAQLVKISSRIQQTASENEALRRENTALRQQLAHLLGSSSV